MHHCGSYVSALLVYVLEGVLHERYQLLLGTECLHVVNADNVVIATSRVTELASSGELQLILFFSKHDSADPIPLNLRKLPLSPSNVTSPMCEICRGVVGMRIE